MVSTLWMAERLLCHQRRLSAALPQLRFTSFAVASSREDLHLQECARAGRTKKSAPEGAF